MDKPDENDRRNTGQEQGFGPPYEGAPTPEQALEERLHPRSTPPASESEAQRQSDQRRHEERRALHRKQVPRKRGSGKRLGRGTLLWIGAGLLVLLLIFLAGYLPHRSREKQAGKESAERSNREPVVEAVKVVQSKEPGELTVPGTTAPYTVAYIYARANGYLRQRFVDIGDRVRKGQLLATIDAPDLDRQVDQARQQLRQAQAQLTQQQSQLDLARVTWQRWKVLVDKGVFSRQDGDQRQADYNVAIANSAAAVRNVEAFQANLQRVVTLQGYERVTAPFNGIITARNVDVGALISVEGAGMGVSPQTNAGGTSETAATNNGGASGAPPSLATPSTAESQGGVLFGIQQIDKLRILVSVPESYALSLRPGQDAEVYVQEYPRQAFHAKVARTSASIDQNTRTLLTEVDVDNRDGRLLAGMYAIVSFTQVRGTPPLIVPGDAVVIRQDKSMVAVIQNGLVHMVPVQIGRDYGPYVEIISGLNQGELIASVVTDDVRDGARIQPKLTSMPGEQEASSGGPAQTEQAPNSGPDQYGDQSITNQSTENTGASSGRSQNSGQNGGQNGNKSGGKSGNGNPGKQ